MATKAKVILFFLLTFYANSLPLERAKPSDLEVGILGDDDVLLTTFESFLEPGSELSSLLVVMESECSNITYLTATESGNYPDATSKLLNGGPGYDYVIVELIPGPLEGFNYTIDLYGPEKICDKKVRVFEKYYM